MWWDLVSSRDPFHHEWFCVSSVDRARSVPDLSEYLDSKIFLLEKI